MIFSDPAVRLVLESMMDAFIGYDPNWRFSYINKQAEILLGHGREDLIGAVLWEYFPEVIGSSFEEHFLRVAATGEASDFEDYNPATGQWLNLRAFRYESGHIGVIWSDITKQKNVESALRKVSEEALAASKAKSDFLANMSHEIRTPLNGVLATASLLLQLELEAMHREYIELIARSGQTLMRVIDDVLDMAKIEAGRMALDLVPEPLPRIVNDVIALHHQQAASLGLTLTAIYGEPVPPSVVVDGLRLRQVLGNLVGNALKFTSRGRVEVRVEAAEPEPGRWHIRLAVVDTGIGIPPEKLGSIFEAFAQADDSTYRRFGGTGLGLSISRHIVELMGGTLTVESEVGVGSRFTVSIDCAGAPDHDSNQGPGQSALRSGITVLIAEDNQVNALIARRTLERLNCVVTHVWNGFQAVEEASRTAFDLILLDVHMPNCNGLEASRLIRSDAVAAQPLIGAFTAGVTQEETRRCQEAGMDFVLGKPFTFNQILDLLVTRFPEHTVS